MVQHDDNVAPDEVEGTNPLARRIERSRKGTLAARIAADEARGRRWNRGEGWGERPLAPPELQDSADSWLITGAWMVTMSGFFMAGSGVAFAGWPWAVAGTLLFALGVTSWRRAQLRLNRLRDHAIEQGYRLNRTNDRFNTVARRHREMLALDDYTMGRKSQVLVALFVLFWAVLFLVDAIQG